jgi:transcriptional regulator with XRE-family HTH domain
MADLVFLDPRRRPRPLLRTLVGDVLRRHRQHQGRTLADVARAGRVSMPYLSEVERGRKEASSEVLAAVCAALQMDLSDLLAEVWRDLAAESRVDGPVHRRRPEPLPTRPAPGQPMGMVRGGMRPARGSMDVVLLAA